MENANNIARYMTNPRVFTLKRWFAELLKEKYPAHDGIVDRLGAALLTEKDVADFGKLVGEIYDVAYRKAVTDYREQFEKLGVRVSVGTEA